MQRINPDKCYIRHNPKTVEPIQNPPANWLDDLANVITQILDLTIENHLDLLSHFNRHLGPKATYTEKEKLLASLLTLYSTLLDSDTKIDKIVLANKILEGAESCTMGFHERVNDLIFDLSFPQSLDALLAKLRQDIVKKTAIQSTDDVHEQNAYFLIANNLGFGVQPSNLKDFSGRITEWEFSEPASDNIVKAFSAQYTLFSILNSLYEQLKYLVYMRGYNGKRDESYSYTAYKMFNPEFFKPFINTLTYEELFEIETDEETDTIKVFGIQWLNIKIALLNKIRKEEYINFSTTENALLDEMLTKDNPSFHSQDIFSLMPNNDELTGCLTFFNELAAHKKAEVIACYLNDKSLEEQKNILKRLDQIPGLSAQLQSQPAMHKVYLTHAIEKDDIDFALASIIAGANINPIFSLLFGRLEKSTLALLYNNPDVLSSITQTTINEPIIAGKHRGKSVAEIWVNSKKGRQLLLENSQLQTLFPEMIADRPKTTWLQQAQTEQIKIPTGFFGNSWLAIQQKEKQRKERLITLLQYVVYGDQDEAEKLIKAYPYLLLEKETVTDYSGRQIHGTALQLALGAEDVCCPHPTYGNEEFMAEMILRYMRQLPKGQEAITEQIAQQFPKDWITQHERSTAQQIIALVEVSNIIFNPNTSNDDCETALQIFRNCLLPKDTITTGHHFGIQLLFAAFNSFIEKNDLLERLNRLDLFWSKVIGYIQRYLPACYAQAFSQNIHSLVDHYNHVDQDDVFIININSRRPYNVPQRPPLKDFFPLDKTPSSRLGFEYGVSQFKNSYLGVYAAECVLKSLRTLSAQKQKRLFIYQQTQTSSIEQRIRAPQ